MRSLVRWWDTHQLALYIGAIAVGAAIGLITPQAAPSLEHSIEPALMLLLFLSLIHI